MVLWKTITVDSSFTPASSFRGRENISTVMIHNCITFGEVPLLVDEMANQHNMWIRTTPPNRREIIAIINAFNRRKRWAWQSSCSRSFGCLFQSSVNIGKLRFCLKSQHQHQVKIIPRQSSLRVVIWEQDVESESHCSLLRYRCLPWENLEPQRELAHVTGTDKRVNYRTHAALIGQTLRKGDEWIGGYDMQCSRLS